MDVGLSEHSSAERNLLFALLAVQVRMADRAAVVAVLRLWVRDRAVWIGRLMLDRAVLSAEQHDALALLVDTQIRAQGGDPRLSLSLLSGPVEGAAIMSELSPEELDDLPDLFDPATAPEPSGLAHPGPAPTVSLDSTPRTTSFIEPPGADARFRKRSVEPFARGGLGALFEADDLEIGRVVAFKELQDRNRSNSAARRRLKFEAEVTGRLEHPNIIPIYGQGERAGGEPFYAMKLVPRPRTLRDLIRDYHDRTRQTASPAERTLAFRDLLGRFSAVCDAVEYAHSRGILHRDLKPANVLVGEFGETMVIDWGLAKFVGTPDPDPDLDPEVSTTGDPEPLVPLSGSDLTGPHPGFIGTPAYASPEQARGDRELSPTADIFALGAILYEILTGRHRFHRPHGHRIPRDELIELIALGRFPAPHTVDSGVDRSLEAICLKALATERRDRYQSVTSLRKDIDRWIADEPVSVRLDRWPTRLGRWGRKHRTLAASSLVGLVLLTSAGAVGFVLERSNAQAQEQLRSEADVARSEADARLDDVMASYEEYFTGFNAEALRGRKLPDDLLESLLEKPRTYYVQLTEDLEGRTNPTSRQRELLARGRLGLGRILASLGRYPEARSEFESSIRLHEALVREHPLLPEYRDELARGYTNLGNVLDSMSQSEGAIAAYSQAISIRSALVREHPDDPEFRKGLARGYSGKGNVFRSTGRIDEAIEAYGRAIEVFEALAREHPGIPEYPDGLGLGLTGQGNMLYATGRIDEAIEAYGRAIEVFEALAREHPLLPDYRDGLALAVNNLANMLDLSGRFDESIAAFDRAISLRKALVLELPGVPEHRESLANSYSSLGIALRASGRPDEAIQSYDQSVAIREVLINESPEVPEYRSGQGGVLNNIGNVLAAQGRHEEAIDRYLGAIEHQQAVFDQYPQVSQYRAFLSNHFLNLAKSLRALGRAGEAASASRRRAALWPGNGAELYDTACELALCIPLSDDRAEADALAVEAVAVLGHAIDAGWSDGAWTASDLDLSPLRHRADFRRLLASLLDRTFPADPFAASVNAMDTDMAIGDDAAGEGTIRGVPSASVE